MKTFLFLFVKSHEYLYSPSLLKYRDTEGRCDIFFYVDCEKLAEHLHKQQQFDLYVNSSIITIKETLEIYEMASTIVLTAVLV